MTLGGWRAWRSGCCALIPTASSSRLAALGRTRGWSSIWPRRPRDDLDRDQSRSRKVADIAAARWCVIRSRTGLHSPTSPSGRTPPWLRMPAAAGRSGILAWPRSSPAVRRETICAAAAGPGAHRADEFRPAAPSRRVGRADRPGAVGTECHGLSRAFLRYAVIDSPPQYQPRAQGYDPRPDEARRSLRQPAQVLSRGHGETRRRPGRLFRRHSNQPRVRGHSCGEGPKGRAGDPRPRTPRIRLRARTSRAHRTRMGRGLPAPTPARCPSPGRHPLAGTSGA